MKRRPIVFRFIGSQAGNMCIPSREAESDMLQFRSSVSANLANNFVGSLAS